MTAKTTWFFGYGSLIWRPYSPHLRVIPARIKGWTRRFWQGSPDHRGTPQEPGRVVTLVRAPEASCHGVCFEVSRDALDGALRQLDHREKAGYERHFVRAKTEDGPTIEGAIMYVAGPDNPDFLGDTSLDQMAKQILTCHGPSGANLDYALNLHQSLIEIGALDPHVESLVRRIRELQVSSGN